MTSMYQQQPQFSQLQQPMNPSSSANIQSNSDWFSAPASASSSSNSAQPNSGMFDPASFQGQMNNAGPSSRFQSDDEDYSLEPPLLEELGVNIPHIIQKTKAVLHPLAAHDPHLTDDTDLAGPLAFALALGVTLMLSGKLHFGYIYGFGVSGCLAMSFLVNLMYVVIDKCYGGWESFFLP